MKHILGRVRLQEQSDLPDELIEYIISFISPVQLCLCGWESVSKGFGLLIWEILSKTRSLDTIKGSDKLFFSQFLSNESNNIFVQKQLQLIIKKLFPFIENFSLSSSLFSAVLECVTRNGYPSKMVMPRLRSLHLYIGDSQGTLNINDFKLARLFAAELKSIKITIKLSDKSDKSVNCCSFRTLLKFLSELIGSAGVWSLCLKDATTRAQGWFCPSELTYSRNIAFICYVRVIIDTGINLNELILIDELKMSPYMMVMKGKRRFIYMYDEFKQCEKLTVCYDIGIVAPSFQVSVQHPQLKSVDLVAAHVLYKNDFLVYLSDAKNLSNLRVHLPPHWFERLNRCTFGCFYNPDYKCFMESGWLSLPTILPATRLQFS